jgi:hypothetical protein
MLGVAMKLVAKVREVLKPGIHKIGEIRDSKVVPTENLPLPARVEIEVEDPEKPCMMFRYTKTGEFCGDTWHEDLESAFSQAGYEYGLLEKDFIKVIEGGGSAAYHPDRADS